MQGLRRSCRRRCPTGRLSTGSAATTSAVPPAGWPPPIVTIRQAGERGAELYVCTSAGARFVVPLSWGHLSNLAADAVAAMIRMSEKE